MASVPTQRGALQGRNATLHSENNDEYLADSTLDAKLREDMARLDITYETAGIRQHTEGNREAIFTFKNAAEVADHIFRTNAPGNDCDGEVGSEASGSKRRKTKVAKWGNTLQLADERRAGSGRSRDKSIVGRPSYVVGPAYQFQEMEFFPFVDQNDKLAIFATSDTGEKAQAVDRPRVQVQFSSSVFGLKQVKETQSLEEVLIVNRPLRDLMDKIIADDACMYSDQMSQIMADLLNDSEDKEGEEMSGDDEGNNNRIRIVDPHDVLKTCTTVGDLKRAVFEGGAVKDEAYSPFITWISENENVTKELWSSITEKKKWKTKIASVFAIMSFILLAQKECATFPDEKTLNSREHNHNPTELHKAAQGYFNHEKNDLRTKYATLFRSVLPDKELPTATNKYCEFMAQQGSSYWDLLNLIKKDIVPPS